MSSLKTIDPRGLGEGASSKAQPDNLVEGDPRFTTWVLDTSRNGQVRTGIWEATPGATRSVKGKRFEFCYILEGVVELVEDGKEPKIYRAGDSFVMKPGYIGTWRTIETARKIFVTVE